MVAQIQERSGIPALLTPSKSGQLCFTGTGKVLPHQKIKPPLIHPPNLMAAVPAFEQIGVQ